MQIEFKVYITTITGKLYLYLRQTVLLTPWG